MKRIIRKTIAAGLIDACFANEGWVKREGQNRTKMVHEVYDVTTVTGSRGSVRFD